MSRVSRRQRAHEEQAGKRKLRNLFALMFLLFAAGLAAYFVWANWTPGQTTIHVVIQRIQTGNYYDKEKSGFPFRRHAIPFQDKTAEKLSTAFKSFTNTKVAELEPIQGLNEEVGLSDDSEINPASISLLYVSGHLKLSDDHNDVDWIYPDQNEDGLATLSVKASLSKIASSNGKLKIVFLDGGQYSWSPNHPNRIQIPFQDKLSEIIQELDQSSNLWVILSHSPNEISLNCTPEKMSIFGLSLREALKSFDSAVSVPDLFREIYQRCATYSRNFDNASLQNPMLFKAGVGLLENLADRDDHRILFARPLQDALADSSEQKKRNDYFDSFADGGLREYENWLADYKEDMHALPVLSAFKLENLMDPGQNLREPQSNARSFNFNRLKDRAVKDKHELVSKFRRNCLDLKLQLAVVNQLLLWNVDQRENVESIFSRLKGNYDWSLSVDYNDEALKKSPVESGDALKTWNRDHEVLIAKLHESWLFNNSDFEKQLANSSSAEDGSLLLTPQQAEQIGVITRRLIPYCKTPLSESTEEASVEVRDIRDVKFQLQDNSYRLNLDLPEESNLPVYKPSSNHLWKDAYDTFNGFAQSIDKSDVDDDSSKRVRLAVYSSEDVVENEPAEIGVSTGKPQIEFTFEDKLKIHEGHNLLFGKIANSRTYYKIKAKLAVENGGDLPDIVYQLFKPEPDQMFPRTDGEAYVETAEKFVFYVFVRPAINNRPDKLRFEFTAQATADQNVEPLTKLIELDCSDEPLISVKTKRDIGTDRNESRSAGLLPWRTNSIETFNIPASRVLKLNAMANLRSKFKFELSNNSSVPMEQLSASLYLVSNELTSIAPDSISDIEDLTDKLGMKTWNVIKFFSDVDNARQLATISDITIPAQRTREINFSFPKPDEGADPDKAAKTVAEEYVHLDAPLLLTVSDQKISDAPLWFQFVEISPISPFRQKDWDVDSSPFQINELIKNRNGFDDFELFKTYMLPEKILDQYEDAGNSSALFHMITRSSRDVSVPPLPIADALNGESFQVPAADQQKTIAMVDVIGIPNLVTMEIDANQTTSRHSRIRQEAFAGVQVISELWEPNQTGFIYNSEVFEPNQINVDQQQPIYLRPRSEDQNFQTGEIKIRLSLPCKTTNSPVTSRENYSYSWNQPDHNLLPTPLENPCLRKYFLRTDNFSIISTFTRHGFKKDVAQNSIENTLKIFQGNESRLGGLIGSYTITTTNPNTDADILNTPKEIASITTEVIIDLSEVKPYCTNVSVGIDKVKGLFIEEVKNVFRPLGNNRFSFQLRDLADELGVNLARAIRDKQTEGGGRVQKVLVIEAVDFFRKKLHKEVPITLDAKKQQTRPKKQP